MAAYSIEDEPRFELIEEVVKSESLVNSPLPFVADHLPAFKASSAPLPSTETADSAETAERGGASAPMPPSTNAAADAATTTSSSGTTATHKKKGTASTIKKAPKRPKPGGEPRIPKKAKAASGPGTPAAEDASDEEESDNGPYCICRGPDDHRWMICCEKCEDWFHGECVHINKEIGEALIEKFICPNCTNGNLMTIYKKTCALNACRKAARLAQDPPSVFCSAEHAQVWWERMLGRLPKMAKAKSSIGDELSQEEFMALLTSNLAAVGRDGIWKIKVPFSDHPQRDTTGNADAMAIDDNLAEIWTDEEREYLDNVAKSKMQLAEETTLCHKMIALIEMVQERRRAAITAGRFSEDICGYDERLDTTNARDAFAAFVKSPEGEAIFQSSKVDDPLGQGDVVRGMCDRKRCKVHSGWQKMLVHAIKHQIREIAGQTAEVGEEEKIVRDAAGERWSRRKVEQNWVEVLDG